MASGSRFKYTQEDKPAPKPKPKAAKKSDPEVAERKQRRTEQEHRRAGREERLIGREQRVEGRERRARITKPIKGVSSAATKGTGSSTALGLGLAGTAALFIAAGIQKKKLGQVLEGDIGETAGQEGKRGEAEIKAGTEITPATEAVSGEPEVKPEGNAPNPFTIGPSLRSRAALEENIRQALAYRDQQRTEVATGKISQKEAAKRFSEKYPHYALWTKQLRELLEQLKREGKVK
jgi:hypothetical protein